MAKSEVTGKPHKQDVVIEDSTLTPKGDGDVVIDSPKDSAIHPRGEDPNVSPLVQPKFGDAKTQELALKIYLAYGATLSYRTLKNEPMPSWDDMHPLERDAWINAAFAAQTGR